MATIYLIRHGQASSGEDDYDKLSKLGHEQAKMLGQEFARRGKSFDTVVVGGMLRHRQTAEQCLAELGYENLDEALNVDFDAQWNEYDHQDILAKLDSKYASAQSIKQALSEVDNPKLEYERVFNLAIQRWMAPETSGSYNESWQPFKQRVESAFDGVVEIARSGKDIAVFTSGGPISLLSQKLLGVDAAQIMSLNWTLLNCGVSKIVVTPNRVFLSTMNEHTHFDAPDMRRFITYA